MNKFEEYKAHLEAIQSLVKSGGEAMVNGFFESLFAEHPKLDVVLVCGYTPGFNDGDPCSHTQYTTFDGDEINDTVDLWDKFSDLEEDEFEEKIEKINSNLSSAEAKKVDDKVDAVDDLLERVYGTDWYIVAFREDDGSITVTDGDYDCGY